MTNSQPNKIEWGWEGIKFTFQAFGMFWMYCFIGIISRRYDRGGTEILSPGFGIGTLNLIIVVVVLMRRDKPLRLLTFAKLAILALLAAAIILNEAAWINIDSSFAVQYSIGESLLISYGTMVAGSVIVLMCILIRQTFRKAEVGS